jgi:hypothetical protein
MTEVYRQYADADHFLYVSYSPEKSFGAEAIQIDLSELEF